MTGGLVLFLIVAGVVFWNWARISAWLDGVPYEPAQPPALALPPPATPSRDAPAPFTKEALAAAIAEAIAKGKEPPAPVAPPPKPEPLPLGYMARMAANISDSMKGLAALVVTDPLLTDAQARLHGIMNSAQSRHGTVIERAFLEALKDNPRFVVWSEPKFMIPHLVDSAFIGGNEAALRQTSMPYGTGEANRTVQMDLIVFDRKTSIVSCYEIKRGNSTSFSSYSNRSFSNNLLAVQMLLVSYCAQTKQLYALKADSAFISYYGAELQDTRGCAVLKRDDLNQHFGFDIVRLIEFATAEFRHRLQLILESPAAQPEPMQHLQAAE